MKWYQELYTGESINGKTEKIRWKINHNAGQLQIYIISFASNPRNLLDIIPAWEVTQKHYPKKNLWIVGLAKTWDEAVMVATRIITDVYENTGGFCVRDYLINKAESRGMA